MASGFIVRLKPAGPWRLGPSSGARDHVDRVLHSDTLYSALTIAADQIGFLAEWLAATAEANQPSVRISSAFPFIGRTLLAPAPKHVWPPSASSRVRWKSARFVPLHVVPRLLAYETLKDDRWAVDPVSEAVLPVEKFGEITPPFRISIRRRVAVDRISGVSAEPAASACLEFAENAGMWCAVFCVPEWRDRVQALFRFVADSGIGGERSSGWGRSFEPEFEALPAPFTSDGNESPEHHETGYWLLSLFAPAAGDRTDWSRGSYTLLRRSGRTQGDGSLKAESAMAEEGSVLIASQPLTGFARNIAAEGATHPVYRAGFALAIPVPVRLPSFYELERLGTVSHGVVSEEPEAPVHDVRMPDVPEPEEFAVVSEDEAYEPFEDASAVPESAGPNDPFVAQSEPIAEQIPATSDGDAFEDGPALPDADGDAIDKQPSEEGPQ